VKLLAPIRIPKAVVGVVLSVVLLATQSLFAYQSEKSFWEQRRQAARRNSPGVLASLPLGPRAGDTLAGQFPSPQLVRSSLTSSVARSLPKTFLKKHADLLTALSPVHGSVRKVSLGKNAGSTGPVVIHIQDVHMNAEAQKNIRETVAGLLKSGRVDLLALEGSTEEIALQPFVDFPNRKAVELTADYLLRENKISGPIHAALTAQGKLPRILGIDDPVHYSANVQAYKDSAPKLEETRQLIKTQTSEIDEQKKTEFSPALLALDQVVSGYRANTVSLGDYVDALVETISRKENRTARHSGMGLAGIHASKFRNVEKLTHALNTERSLDFKQVESERSRLIEKLTHSLNAHEINDLMAQSLAYRTGELRYGDFYTQLKDTCRKKGIRLSDYPAMAEYVRYVLLCDGIDAEQLLNELMVLEKTAYDVLANTPEEKALVTQSRQVWLTSKLVDFSLTPPEWKEYKSGPKSDPIMSNPSTAPLEHLLPRGEGNLDVIPSPLGRGEGEGLKLSTKDGVLATFESFYREAEARDTAMAQNLLSSLNLQPRSDSHPTPIALLVTGGFHAEGMAKQLTEKGATVISYVPKIEKIDAAQGSTYLSVFTQERTPLERLFEGEKLFLSQHPASRTLLRTLLPALVAVVAGLLGLAVEGADSAVPIIYASLGGLGTLSLLTISKNRATVRIQNGYKDTKLKVDTEGGVIAQATETSVQAPVWRAFLDNIRSEFSRAQEWIVDRIKPLVVSNPAAIFRSLSLFFGSKLGDDYGIVLTRYADWIGIAGLVIEIPILVWVSVITPFWMSAPLLLLISYFHDYLESQVEDRNPPNLMMRRIILMLYLIFPFVGFNSISELAILLQAPHLAHIVLAVPLVHLIFDFINISYFTDWKEKLNRKKRDKVREIEDYIPGLKVKGWENAPFKYLEDIQSILQRIPPKIIPRLKVISLGFVPWFVNFELGGWAKVNGTAYIRVSPWRGRFRNVFAHEIGHVIHLNNQESLDQLQNIAWRVKEDITIIDTIMSIIIPDYLHTPRLDQAGLFVTAYSLTNPMEHFAEIIRVCMLYPEKMNERDELNRIKNELSNQLGIDFHIPVFKDVFGKAAYNWLRFSFLLSLWAHLIVFFPHLGLIISTIPILIGSFYSRVNYLFQWVYGDLIAKSSAKILIKLRSGKILSMPPVEMVDFVKKQLLFLSMSIVIAIVVGVLVFVPIPHSKYVNYVEDLDIGDAVIVVFTNNKHRYRACYFAYYNFANPNKILDGNIEVYQGHERMASFIEDPLSFSLNGELKLVNPQERQIASAVQWMFFKYQESLRYASNPRDAVMDQISHMSNFVKNIEVRYDYSKKTQDQEFPKRQEAQVRPTILATIKPNANVIVKSETQVATQATGLAPLTVSVNKTPGDPNGLFMVVRDPRITPDDVDRVKRLFVERTRELVEREIPRLDMNRSDLSRFERRLYFEFRNVARLKYEAREILNKVIETSAYIYSPVDDVNTRLRELFLKDALDKKLDNPESGRGTSLWGLKFAEWLGSKVDPKNGRERFGAEYKRFAAFFEWSFSAKIAFWGLMGTLGFAGAGAGFGWLIAPVAGVVYGILFVASHFIVPESMTPVTKVKVGVGQSLSMGVIYGVLIGITPFLLGAVPLLGVPEFGVQVAGVLWGLAGSLHFSIDKEDHRKEGEQAARDLVGQMSGVPGAFESMMPGIQEGHTDQIVGKRSSSPDSMTETLSRLKSEKEFRAGFLGAVQKAMEQGNLSPSQMNLLSALVKGATGQPIAFLHILGKSPLNDLAKLETVMGRGGPLEGGGFPMALVVSAGQTEDVAVSIAALGAKGVQVFEVTLESEEWNGEILRTLESQMSTWLDQANGIVATVGTMVGINPTDIEALQKESKLREALKNAVTFGDVVETFLRTIRALASNA
jgi:hypothetical protein